MFSLFIIFCFFLYVHLIVSCFYYPKYILHSLKCVIYHIINDIQFISNIKIIIINYSKMSILGDIRRITILSHDHSRPYIRNTLLIHPTVILGASL